jgi:Cu+-exporting ATPase
MGKVEIINAIEDAGFDAELIQSVQQDILSVMIEGLFSVEDAKFVEDMFHNMKGVRDFVVDYHHLACDTSVSRFAATLEGLDIHSKLKALLPLPEHNIL